MCGKKSNKFLQSNLLADQQVSAAASPSVPRTVSILKSVVKICQDQTCRCLKFDFSLFLVWQTLFLHFVSSLYGPDRYRKASQEEVTNFRFITSKQTHFREHFSFFVIKERSEGRMFQQFRVSATNLWHAPNQKEIIRSPCKRMRKNVFGGPWISYEMTQKVYNTLQRKRGHFRRTEKWIARRKYRCFINFERKTILSGFFFDEI